MIYKEKILFYDARVAEIVYPTDWPVHVNCTFVLRDDLEGRARTLDLMLWPSLVDKSLLPSKNGYSLNEIETHLTQLRENVASYWIIAATVVLTGLDPEDTYFYLDEFPRNPSSIQSDWQRLGYDVVENGAYLSGLSNMGYPPEEEVFAKKRFGSYLNKYHLFNDQEPALDFKKWCDTRDPGHGPFYVAGIYLIRKAET